MLSGRALSPLWSLLAIMRISLSVVWLKDAFHVCTNPLMTPHDLIKTKIDRLFMSCCVTQVLFGSCLNLLFLT